MLSKNNKILIGCLALLLVMSVGYALFSDTITVTGTATAKGDFDITPTCISGPVLGTESLFSTLGLEEKGYKNETCSVDNATDSVSFDVQLDYPGALKIFTVKMTNTGSINATFPMTVSMDKANSKLCMGENMEQDAKTEGSCVPAADEALPLTAYAVQIGDGQIYAAEDPTKLPVDVQLAFSEGDKLVLKPGNSVYYYTYAMVNDFFHDDNFINFYMQYRYNVNFEQVTN